MTKENKVAEAGVLDPMEGMEEQKVEYNNLKFGKVGDFIRGTLTDNSRQIQNNLSKTKEMQTIYQFKIIAGSFHDIVKRQVQETITECKPGEFWSYITGKNAIVQQLKSAKIGQIVGLRLAEIKPSKTPGYDDTKIIKVFLGGMDPEYQGETNEDSK